MNNHVQGIKVQEPRANLFQQNWYLLRRKQTCPNHDLKYRFECKHPKCEHPFICNSLQCLDQHFHQDTLVVKRFSREKLHQKIQRAEEVFKKQTIFIKEVDRMKAALETYKRRLVDFFSDLQSLKNHCQDVEKMQQQNVLNQDFLDKVDNINKEESELAKNIEWLKTKVNFSITPGISEIVKEFLSKQIKNFDLQKASLIWNTFKETDKFPKLVQNKPRLLFFFIGQKITIGSYFSTEYPSLEQRNKKAPGSFLFYHQSNSEKVIKYNANSQCQSHIQISQKMLISHGNTASGGVGIRSALKSLNFISYFLPTEAYKEEEKEDFDKLFEDVTDHKSKEEECKSGQLKLKQLLVYQLSE